MSGYFGPMAAVSTVAFALGAALASRNRRVALLALGTAGAALVAPALFGIAAVVSGTNAGAGLESRRGRSLDLRLATDRARRSSGAQPRCSAGHVDSFWDTHRHGSNRVETTNYLGLLTFSLALTWLVISVRRWRLARRARAAGDRRPHCDVHRRARVRSAEPDRPVRPQGLDTDAPPVGSGACVPCALALGCAAHDGTRPARRARPPGDGARRRAEMEIKRDRRRRRRSCDGVLVLRACDPSGRGSVQDRPGAAGVQGARPNTERNPRGVPARLLRHLSPLAEPSRPPDPERRAAGHTRGLRPARSARPGRSGNGREAVAPRCDCDRDPSVCARRRGDPPAGPEAGPGLRPRRQVPAERVRLARRRVTRRGFRDAPRWLREAARHPRELQRVPADRVRRRRSAPHRVRNRRASFASSSKRHRRKGRRGRFASRTRTASRHFGSQARRRCRCWSRSRGVNRSSS